MIEEFSPHQRLTGSQATKALAAAAQIATARVRAQEIMATAEAEVTALRADAQREAEEIIRQARTAAEDAKAEAQKHLAGLEADLRKEMSAQLDAELGAIAGQLNDIVLAALEKIVGEIGVAAMVRATVLHILRSNPQIVASRLRVAAATEIGALGDLPLDVAEDPGLEPGEAVLDTEQGMVDLGLAAQLATLAASVGATDRSAEARRGAA